MPGQHATPEDLDALRVSLETRLGAAEGAIALLRGTAHPPYDDGAILARLDALEARPAPTPSLVGFGAHTAASPVIGQRFRNTVQVLNADAFYRECTFDNLGSSDPYLDCVDINDGRIYFKHCTFRGTPDNLVSIWNHDDGYGTPQVTFDRCRFEVFRTPLVGDDEDAVLIGAKLRDGTVNTHVTFYRCVFGDPFGAPQDRSPFLDRQPLAGHGAWVHMVNCVHGNFNHAGVQVRDGSRELIEQPWIPADMGMRPDGPRRDRFLVRESTSGPALQPSDIPYGLPALPMTETLAREIDEDAGVH